MTSHNRVETLPPPVIQLTPRHVWDPCHAWTDNTTTWIDAYLITDGLPEQKYLDIGCLGDDCCTTPEHRDPAAHAWETGTVHVITPYPELPHITALILPHATLNTVLVHEALNRYAAILTNTPPS